MRDFEIFNGTRSKVEEILDLLFTAFNVHLVIDCPQSMLNKFNNGSKFRLPTTTPSIPTTTKMLKPYDVPLWVDEYIYDPKIIYTLTGAIIVAFMLSLNRKRYIQSSAMRLFTNYYFGFIFVSCCFHLVIHIFDYWIWTPLMAKYALCSLQSLDDPDGERPKIDFLKNSLGVPFPRWFSYISFLMLKFDYSLKLSQPIFLIIHRLTTYFACSHPIIYRRYFGIGCLKFYYSAVGIGIYILHLFLNIVDKKEWIYVSFVKYFINYTTTTLVIIHLIITIFSIRVLIKYRKSAIQKNAFQEFKSFLGFSLGPVIISLIEEILHHISIDYTSLLQFILRTFGINFPFGLNYFTFMASFVVVWLHQLLPHYTSALYFIFVPFYRNLLFRPFRKLTNRVSVIHVGTTAAGNVSRNI